MEEIKKVAVIGGGAAGFFAALSVAEHHPTAQITLYENCLLYTSPSPRDRTRSRMPSSA